LFASAVRGGGLRGAETRRLLEELHPHDLALCWLGHASVAGTIGRLTFAADPVLSERIGPRVFGRTWGLSRKIVAPVEPDALRGVSLVLLTHAHFDHLDRLTLAGMASAETVVVAPRRCASLVPAGFADVVELDAGDQVEVMGASVRAIEPRHWGARLVVDRRRGANMYALDYEGVRVLLAGDTGMTKSVAETGPFDIAVFGVGAYEPWEHMHATPEQVWRMFELSRSEFLVPVHHSTFALSDEPDEEPMKRLAASARDESARILKMAVGEVVVLPGRDGPNCAGG
jgi:L-ascorbate metabolism protein UlaG (beta-lactamase superfamily)